MPDDTAITIYKNIARPAADIIKKCEVPTGYIADVQGRRGALDCGIKPLFDFPTIVGDRDGIAVLPRKKISPALEGIEAVRKRERAIEERIAAGMTMPDWVEEFLAGDRVKILE